MPKNNIFLNVEELMTIRESLQTEITSCILDKGNIEGMNIYDISIMDSNHSEVQLSAEEKEDMSRKVRMARAARLSLLQDRIDTIESETLPKIVKLLNSLNADSEIDKLMKDD